MKHLIVYAHPNTASFNHAIKETLVRVLREKGQDVRVRDLYALHFDPVLKAGIAHFWFVTIHPFEDGNGRISRAIADMALARAEGTMERFYSMSTQIEAEKKHYYLNLEQSQKGGVDITSWLEWFLGCLGRAVAGAEDGLASVLRKAKTWERINSQSPVNERQRTVINRLLDGFEGNLSTSKYAKLAKCSGDTALRDINILLNQGVLVQVAGGGRNTSYRLVEPENQPIPTTED